MSSVEIYPEIYYNISEGGELMKRRDVLSVTLEPRIIALLKTAAKREGISVSRLVERILKKALRVE